MRGWLRLPGSHVPIVPPEALADSGADDLIILPWNIAPEIAGQLAGLRKTGTQFWTACPTMQRV